MNQKNKEIDEMKDLIEHSNKGLNEINSDLEDYNDYLRNKEKQEDKEIISEIRKNGIEDPPDNLTPEEVIEKIESGELRVTTNSIGGNLDMSQDMQKIIKSICGDVNFKIDDDMYLLPIFGLLSTIASKTPFYMYGNNTILGQRCKTAFTDGINIFVNDAFWRNLIDKEKIENKGVSANEVKSGRLFLLLHELSHIVHNDLDRGFGRDPRLLNIACDIRINGTIEQDFKHLKVLNYMKKIGVGFTDELENEYANLSPERIYEKLMQAKKENSNKKQQKSNSLNDYMEEIKEIFDKAKKEASQQEQEQGQDKKQEIPNEKGGRKPENSKQQKSKDSIEEKLSELANDAYSSGLYDARNDKYNNKVKKENYNPSNLTGNIKDLYDKSYDAGYKHGQSNEELNDLAGSFDEHMIQPSDIRDMLNDMGVSQEVLDHLGYDEKTSNNELNDKFKQKNSQKIEDSVFETECKYRENNLDPSNLKIPGAHIFSSATENIKIKRKGKLTWFQHCQEKIYGSGVKTEYTENVVSPIYYVDEMKEILGTELFEGILLNHKSDEVVACIIDTSGSMSAGYELKEALTECVSIQNVANNSDAAREVVIYFADTSLRGKPLNVNEDNIEEIFNSGISAEGRGGTDLINPINELFESDSLKEKKIRSVVYFTDMGCTIPSLDEFTEKVKKEILNGAVDITFIGVPDNNGSYYQFEAFKDGVKDFAETFKLKEGETVDLGYSNKKRNTIGF